MAAAALCRKHCSLEFGHRLLHAGPGEPVSCFKHGHRLAFAALGQAGVCMVGLHECLSVAFFQRGCGGCCVVTTGLETVATKGHDWAFLGPPATTNNSALLVSSHYGRSFFGQRPEIKGFSVPVRLRSRRLCAMWSLDARKRCRCRRPCFPG